MKISLNWIQDYLKTSLSADELESGLTGLGLECTAESNGNTFSGVVVGKVIECEKHPNADKLSLCKVNPGGDTLLDIVCGAPNVRVGISVPVAPVGSTLKSGKIEIKKTKIRGVESNGMICSGLELDLSDDHTGILILDTYEPPGTDFINILNHQSDTVFEIDLTPNRGDCLGHLGVAREIGILENKTITRRNSKVQSGKRKVNELASVNIHSIDGCPRYVARVLTGVKISPSPDWLVQKLTTIGQKSINNVVDAANFVLMDTGHPMHTFDLDKLADKKIEVRFAKNGEKITLLDEQEYELKDFHLLICDSEKPVALAGIMGDMKSGITEKTTDILIESAYFDPTVIRKGAKYLDLSTEASKRFERDTDIECLIPVIDQLASLIVEVAGGEIADGIIDEYPEKKKIIKIQFSLDDCNAFLGVEISSKEIESFLTSLDIKWKKTKLEYKCTIPTFRNDLTRPVDLYEEIARIYGYDNIPLSPVYTGSYTSFIKDKHKQTSTIKSALANLGFHEHYSNSLTNDKCAADFSNNTPVKLSNPISQEMENLRTSLIPGLLDAISYNEKRRQKNFKLFEVGAVHKYIPAKDTKSVESFSLVLVWSFTDNQHWRVTNKTDIFRIKGELTSILQLFGCKNIQLAMVNQKGFKIAFQVYSGKIKLGILGVIDTSKLKEYEIKNDVFIFEGSIEKIRKSIESNPVKISKPNTFPAISRDIAIQINNDIPAEKVQEVILSKGSEYLCSVNLFDIYRDEKLGNDQKSLAYSLKFQSSERTLVDDEADEWIKNIITELKSKFKITQR